MSKSPTADAIAKRAYEISQQRGFAPGHETDDWLQAEAELTAAASVPVRRERAATPPPPPTPASPEPAVRASRQRAGGGRRAARQPQSQ